MQTEEEKLKEFQAKIAEIETVQRLLIKRLEEEYSAEEVASLKNQIKGQV